MAEVVVKLLLNENLPNTTVSQWEAQAMDLTWDPPGIHFWIGAGARPWDAVFDLLAQRAGEE